MNARRVAIAFAAGSGVLCAVAAVFLGLSFGASIGEGSWGFRGFGLLNAIAFTAIGATVAIRRPSNLIGRFLLASGALWALTELEFEYAVYAIAGRPTPLPGGLFVAWLGSWEWTINVGLYPVLLVIFPDGRISTPARRAVIAASAAVTGLLAFAFAFRPGPLQLNAFVENPFTPLPRELIDAANVAALVITFPMVIVAGGMLIRRFRRSVGVERQQLKWLAFASVPVLLIGPLSGILPGKPIQVLGSLVQLALPATIGLAVLRYRLYDIDALINRSLVYGGLTAILAATYFAIVLLLQTVLRPVVGGSEVAVAVSTLATLALFQPLRQRTQVLVDRRFYRSRYDATRTLDAFGVRLRDQVDLDAVRGELLASVNRTLQPVTASLWLRPE